MRKLTLLAVIILSVFICSCGSGGSGEKNASDKSEKAEERMVLDTKEAMMAKLQEFNITVPENMTFREVAMQPYLNKEYEQDTSYIVYFDIKNIDEATKNQLYEWYDKQFSELIEDGWTEVEYNKDKEMMGGGVYSNYSFKKASEHCTLKIGISYNDEKNCTIHLAPRFDI